MEELQDCTDYIQTRDDNNVADDDDDHSDEDNDDMHTIQFGQDLQ